MKKVLKFAGLISAVLALAAFIFLLAGNAIVYETSSATYKVTGTRALFGGEVQTLLGTVEYKPAATALIAWILILVAMLVLIVNVVLPLLKVTALAKFAGLLNLVAACALIVGGILLFFTKTVYASTNDLNLDDWKLAFAFVFAGILSILAGLVALAPAAVEFVGKKK